MKRSLPDVVIISGLSGSGKSSALNTLEDAGWFAIDNLPGELFQKLMDLDRRDRIAVVMDAREGSFLKNFEGIFQMLKSRRIRFCLFFLDARDDVLLRRFSETRRRHPLAPFETVSRGIQKEREILHPLRTLSHHIVDTSRLNVHDLRKKILSLLKQDRLAGKKELSLSLISFGYRYGLPLESDLVFDVRFLPNPHFVTKLRPLSGQNPKVRRFVLRQKTASSFLRLLRNLLGLLLRESLKEGKSYLTVSFGCTGGRHRSVVIAEKVAQHLKVIGYPVRIQHRDIHRGT